MPRRIHHNPIPHLKHLCFVHIKKLPESVLYESHPLLWHDIENTKSSQVQCRLYNNKKKHIFALNTQTHSKHLYTTVNITYKRRLKRWMTATSNVRLSYMWFILASLKSPVEVIFLYKRGFLLNIAWGLLLMGEKGSVYL